VLLYKISEAIGKQIVLFLGLILFYVSIFITFNAHIHPSIFYLSLITTILIFIVIQIKNIKVNYFEYTLSVLAFLFVVFLAFKIAPLYYDFSFDGQGYQQNGTISLKEGWNPLYDEELGDLWIDHYAKGNWYISAVFYAAFDQLELIKAYNVLMLLAAFFLLIAVLKSLHVHVALIIPIALVTAANPVTITQLFTTYNDGLIGPALICLMIMIYFVFKRKSALNYCVLAAVIVIISNIKFTAFGYAVIVCGVPIVYMMLSYNIRSWWNVFKNKYLHYVLITAGSFLLAILFVGSTSYVSNTIDHGHPFFPLAGEGKVDIMTPNMPQSLVGTSWGEKLFRSVFSETANFIEGEPKLKNPFTVSQDEIWSSGDVDIRVAGLGPLFGATLILTVLSALLTCLYIFKRENRFLWYVFLALVLTIAINPEPWWMRYIPQLWLVVAMLIIIVYKSSKLGQWLAALCVTVMLLNVGLVAHGTKGKLDMNLENLTQQLEVMRKYSEENELLIDLHWSTGNRIRFEEYGIKYKELVFYNTDLDPAICELFVYIQSSTARVCTKDEKLLNDLTVQ
jgi:hypothetical protein